MSNEQERVICAMSGGVDSSVAAKLLVDAGYDVMGVTMKLFDSDGVILEEGSRTCCSLEDVEDARAVAFGLGIPYQVFNYTDTFGTCVIDRFCQAYLEGHTPNPCIDCNRFLKFGALQQRRRELGFDYVATGHYARRAYDEETGRYLLLRGRDPKKDQSYVLYHLTQEHLKHMLFPVGELEKPQVRAVAHEAGLGNADKLESQDICFVPDGDYASFIEQYTGQSSEPGDFVDKEGKVLGKHKGQIHYTIGQRRGLGISAPESLYVCGKSLDSNEVILGSKQDLMSNYCYINDINLIPWDHLDAPIKCKVKTRYRQPEQPATVEQIGEDLIKITFDEPQRAVTPGQAAVLYDDDMVLGGGTILPEGLASTMTTSQGTNI